MNSPELFQPWSTYRAREVAVLCTIFMLIASCGFGLRMYCKYIKRTRLALDDFALFLGLIFCHVSAVLTILQVQFGGLGHPLSEVVQYPDRLIIMGKIGLDCQYAYFLSMAFIRWSIIILFLRIFITKTTRFLLWTCFLANSIWLLTSLLLITLRCHPVSSNWDITPNSHCLPQIPIVSAIAGVGLLIEITMWLIPLPAVWNLQMPLRKKIALTCVFGLGIIDIGIGIARVLTVVFIDIENFSWSEVPALELIAAEPAVAVLVASLCTCHPLLELAVSSRWMRSVRSLTTRLLGSKTSLGEVDISPTVLERVESVGAYGKADCASVALRTESVNSSNDDGADIGRP